MNSLTDHTKQNFRVFRGRKNIGRVALSKTRTNSYIELPAIQAVVQAF